MHTLDSDQQQVFDEVMTWCEEAPSSRALDGRHTSRSGRKHRVMVIQGAAGTGKSTLLSSLFLALSERSRQSVPNDAISGATVRVMVNHAEMWKRYRDFAGENRALKKSQVLRPTSYINAANKTGIGADIVLVDEAHLLLTQPNPYMHFTAENQLAEIVRHTPITILAYDESQVLRMRSMWNEDVLSNALGDVDVVNCRLGNQHRMGASLEVRDWIARLLQGQEAVTPPPKGDNHFDMQVFSNAGDMRDALVNCSHNGSARLLSTYDYPYRLDGNDYFIEEVGLHIRWDRYEPQSSLAWPERPETLNEVGSVYTIQGLDLDWAGVILGPSNVLGKDGTLQVQPDLYQDQAAFVGVTRLRKQGYGSSDIEDMKEHLLRNALMTLLTRPRKGLFIYAHDPELSRALSGVR